MEWFKPNEFEMTDYEYTQRKNIHIVLPDDRQIEVERDFIKYKAEESFYDTFDFISDFSEDEKNKFIEMWDNGDFEDMIEW
ncbi:MAG: hypothetical protein EOL97_13525 [Spirochaetia bacterium]|nr:hypothetical protein [Spirochaetia bacterium]